MIRRWGERVGYSAPERLELVLRAIRDPQLTTEALTVVEDLRRTTQVGVSNLVLLYLVLDARSEALRSVQAAIAERAVLIPYVVPYLAAFGRERKLEYPEIFAAFEGAGISIR